MYTTQQFVFKKILKIIENENYFQVIDSRHCILMRPNQIGLVFTLRIFAESADVEFVFIFRLVRDVWVSGWLHGSHLVRQHTTKFLQILFLTAY